MISNVTYGRLDGLLRNLGFVLATIEGPWRAYTHVASETMILLADRRDHIPARDADIASVRRHLIDRNLIDEDEFTDFMQGRRSGIRPSAATEFLE